MNQSEVKKCPKCGGTLEKGKGLASYGYVVFMRTNAFLRGDKIIAHYCKNCGYIELYKKIKERKE